MLQRIPQNKQRIAVLVNSRGGCIAQTHLIAQKISHLARKNNAEVWTFGQEWALNSAALLLASGHRVFVDSTTVVGGCEVGEAKLLRGKWAQYTKNVTYSDGPSYAADSHSEAPFSTEKRKQLENIYGRFGNELQAEIRRLRGEKAKEVDLSRFYVGEEAVSAGLADAVDRVHMAFGRESVHYDARLVAESRVERLFERMRQVNASE